MFKKILTRGLIILAVIIVAFVGIVAMQPNDYRVARSATMVAPPAKIFAQVNDFHNWEKWSPWLQEDPNAKSTFEGPEEGKGAIFRWAGNNNVGEGNMTITESEPNDLIRINLQFLKPMEGTATSEFTFKPEGDQTLVTWSMSGKNNFIGKAICMFMNMDKMIGDKYDEGLASIKKIVEAEPKVDTEVESDTPKQES